MKKILLSLFIFSSAFAIYIEDLNDLEDHKTLAYIKEFEAVGMLYCEGYYGSGTLIHPRVVLTAAHVVTGATDITYYLSINNKYVKSVKGKAIIHPDYEKTIKNEACSIHEDNMPYDVALVFLDEPIDEIDYPCISSSPPPIPADYYAIGYGGWNGEPPETLIEMKLSGISFGSYLTKNKSLIRTPCSNYMDIDLFGTGRPGDSGGPLMRLENDKVIYGVLSCLIYEAEADPKDTNTIPLFSIYSSVHSYLDWLLKTMEENI